MRSEPLNWYEELSILSFHRHFRIMIERLLGYKVEVRVISEDEVPADILEKYKEEEDYYENQC